MMWLSISTVFIIYPVCLLKEGTRTIDITKKLQTCSHLLNQTDLLSVTIPLSALFSEQFR